jgi:hypothetical protein
MWQAAQALLTVSCWPRAASPGGSASKIACGGGRGVAVGPGRGVGVQRAAVAVA